MLGLCLVLSGCRDATGGSTGLEDDTQDTVGSVDSGDSGGAESSPIYTAQDVGQLVAELAETGLPTARELRDSYQTLMLNGDEGCPGSATEIEDLLEGCTSETGWYFGGLLTFVTEEVEDEEGRRAKNFWTDTCDFQIVSPTGVALIGGGDIEGRWQQQGSERLVSTSMVKGTWIYPESEHNWLSAGMSMDLAFRLDREEGADNLNLWGTFGTPGIDLYLDNLYFDGNEACGGQVSSGTSWLRQADGTWYEMVWAEDCSGCFTVEWDFTEDLGEACIDLSGLKATVVAELEVEP